MKKLFKFIFLSCLFPAALYAADVDAYKNISIISPADQQVIVNNETGNIDIKIKIEPKLQQDNKLQIVLDGKNSSNTQLKNIDRGEHTLLAEIIDNNQKVLIESAPIIFYMQRPSVKKP